MEKPKYLLLHTFISYSRANKTFVDRLVGDLTEAAISIWIDREGLEPGTPNWEQGLRDAIEVAFAVLLITTPESRKSVYVQGELNLAQQLGIQVYPIWAEGDTWIDSIPFGMVNYQYIDCRGDAYESGVQKIVGILKSILSKQIPPHGLIKAKSYADLQYAHKCLPDYIHIYSNIEIDNIPIIAAKLSTFKTIRNFLDTIYVNYLYRFFLPHTYGRDWLLLDSVDDDVLAPFSWLKTRGVPIYLSNPHWFRLSLKSFSFVELSICHPDMNGKIGEDRYYGIATNNKKLLRRGQDKTISSLIYEGYLRTVNPTQVEPGNYKYTAIRTGLLTAWHSNEAIVDTDKEIPDSKWR
jgi:hypothetical protein